MWRTNLTSGNGITFPGLYIFWRKGFFRWITQEIFSKTCNFLRRKLSQCRLFDYDQIGGRTKKAKNKIKHCFTTTREQARGEGGVNGETHGDSA
jgi:hypothetical protein